jgi:predicted ribosomally synthesized peptide with nif11-like leader
MSIESAQTFLERMKTDEEFAKKVSACTDAEARMALVKTEGFDFSAAEIKELQTEMTEAELDVCSGGLGQSLWKPCGVRQMETGDDSQHSSQC